MKASASVMLKAKHFQRTVMLEFETFKSYSVYKLARLIAYSGQSRILHLCRA